jgi:hypothetical protein
LYYGEQLLYIYYILVNSEKARPVMKHDEAQFMCMENSKCGTNFDEEELDDSKLHTALYWKLLALGPTRAGTLLGTKAKTKAKAKDRRTLR